MRRDDRLDEAPHEQLDRLEMALGPHRRALLDHPLYGAVTDAARLRVFMAHHVFAVWDFMSLLKRLQRELTCVELPWMPPPDPECARLINDIVLEEETDRVGRYRHLSHFELYLLAMAEMDADASAVRTLMELLRAGLPPEQALARTPVAESTRLFTVRTLRMAQRAPHEVAAAFLYGREDVIPSMFKRILWTLDRQDPLRVRARRRLRSVRETIPDELEHRLPSGWRLALERLGEDQEDPRFHLRLYLHRHIELDADTHAPMARRLLGLLCGREPGRWAEAERAAVDAIEARRALWDGVLQAVEGREVFGATAESPRLENAAPRAFA